MSQNSTSFEAVLFDYAGVLTTPAYNESDYLDEMSGKFGIDTSELYACFSESKLMHRLLIGEITEEELIASVCGHFSHATPIDRSDLRSRDYASDPETLLAIDEFRRTNVAKLVIVSNIFPECIEYLDTTGTLAHFDAAYFSCVVGDRKPNPSFFTYIIDSLGVDPTACLFFDDALPNTESARTLGMTVVHVTDTVQVRETLSTL